MIISIRSMSYEDLKNSLSKEDKIVIWSCNTCIRHCGFAGYEKMKILETMLQRDGYKVIKKELLGVSCLPNLVEDRKVNITKNQIFNEATAIIVLACEAGWDCVYETFPDKKVIKVIKTLGVGICSPTRGTLLTNPFKEIDIEANPEGTPIKEVAQRLNLYHTFFNDDKEIEPITEQIEISINGTKVKASKGDILLNVSEENGFPIPHLCYMECLGGVGACRLCLVKIKGRNGLVPACCTQITAGMEVITEDDEINEYRRMILELILASHEHNCLFCSHNSSCELQALIHEFGIDKIRFPVNSEKLPIDYTNEALIRDPNRCILCGRCIRACDEIAGKHNLAFLHRGNKTIVAAGYDKTMGDSDCEKCLACVYSCPTGALSESMFCFTGSDWKRTKIYGYYM